jgi:transcriptional regulator with XRE-family HTH domain
VISSVLKEARTAKNISQSEIAEMVGVTKQTYLKWENGATEPKASQVVKLAEALSISETEICRGVLNTRMSLKKFIIERSKIDADTSLDILRTWEQLPDHNRFLTSLIDSDLSEDDELIIDMNR